MHKIDIYEELADLFPSARINFADETYAAMTAKSFLKTSSYIKWILKIFGIFGWRDKFDCDDFAMIWKLFASLRHAKSLGGKSEGIACGIIWYIKDISGGGHAVNLVRTENGWQAFEPQTEEFFELSKSERESVWFVLL